MASKSTQIWEIDEKQFPSAASLKDQASFVVNYATLAPSAWNSQPWKFHIEDNTIEVLEDSSRKQNHRDPSDRENVISCGAALFNLRLALNHFGFDEEASLYPSAEHSELAAKVSIQKNKNANKQNKLFSAITKRRSFRKPFDERDVSPEVIAILKKAAAAHGVTFMPITLESTQLALAGMISEGDKDLGSDPETRKEYASWVRSGAGKGDGVPGYALGMNSVEAMLAPITARVLNYTDENARRDRALTCATTLIGVFTTANDTRTDWLNSGQALQHTLLAGVNFGLQASCLNQPIPVPELRNRLRKLLSTEEWPQMIIRIGFTEETIIPTPRRSLSEVLV